MNHWCFCNFIHSFLLRLFQIHEQKKVSQAQPANMIVQRRDKRKHGCRLAYYPNSNLRVGLEPPYLSGFLPICQRMHFLEACCHWIHSLHEFISFTLYVPTFGLSIAHLQWHETWAIQLDKTYKMFLPKRSLLKRRMHCVGSIKGWSIIVDTLLGDQIGSSSAFANHQFPSFFFWNLIVDARVMLSSKL